MFNKIRHSITHKLRSWFPDREIEYDALILALVVGFTVVLTILPAPPSVWTVSPYTTAEWAAMVERYGVAPRVDGAVRATVPRVYLKQFPGDWPASLSVAERKRLFVAALLPLILAENERVSADRARMLPILRTMDDGAAPSRRSRKYVETLSETYGLNELDARLLRRRVAPVPVSLALAQAAIESGWGTSRFAKEGNAAFGQWVWNEDAGIVPGARRVGASYAVRSFEDLRASVRAYIHNLNTHYAYREFRDQRASLTKARDDGGKSVSGAQLATTLLRYSERREKYVAELQVVIRFNELEALQDMRLSNEIVVQTPDVIPASI
jgi:Bax protein